ncbi:MAG: phosphoadenylyl-sulfate reductase [Trueperaceae bacterium]
MSENITNFVNNKPSFINSKPENWNEKTDPKDVIRWAIANHPNLTMTSGFNLNGTVLLDMAVEAGYRGEVIFVNTGYHFQETLETRNRVQEAYPEIKLVTLTANLPDDSLFLKDTDACCFARKVAPLQNYLARKQPTALLNARSREQADTRIEIPFIESGKERARVNPLAYWTRERLESYAKAKDLPINPLYWEGFLSIGCAPCTRAVRPGEDIRAGRWTGQGKTECGLWTNTGV